MIKYLIWNVLQIIEESFFIKDYLQYEILMNLKKSDI